MAGSSNLEPARLAAHDCYHILISHIRTHFGESMAEMIDGAFRDEAYYELEDEMSFEIKGRMGAL
jgi:hypothetical protein